MAGEVKTDSSQPKPFNLSKLRNLVRSYIDKHQYDSALFWANKLVSLSTGESRDIYWCSQTLYLTKQYHRAAHMIKSHSLEKKHLAARHLLALCYYECKEFQEALDALDAPKDDLKVVKVSLFSDGLSPSDASSDSDIPSQNINSSINLLRGRIYEAMENRGLAAECFREALRQDVFCHEAFDCLVMHHMLSAQEEKELLLSLPFEDQCSGEEVELVRFLYQNQLKKYSKPSENRVPASLGSLKDNLELEVHQAERHYYNSNFQQSYTIASRVLKKDPYNTQCLPLYISTLMELNKPNELFYLAHKLVDLYPDKAVAWFAVGCYYQLVGKHEPARRYLSKATALDRVFGPAWLAYGHSFAAENEHDQAMAAYFTASQIMKGCHLPVLYIGLEYGLTHNAKLAERFFGEALSIAPEDPFVLQEMGVIAFQNGEYDQALEYMKSALDKVEIVSHPSVMAEKWEPLLNNLGHVCRKLKKYEESLEYHRQALILRPNNPSTLSAMGYVTALMGRSAEAVDFFHKALGFRRDDTFSTNMLSYAIEQLMTDMSPCEGELEPMQSFAITKLSTPASSDITARGDDTLDADKIITPAPQPIRPLLVPGLESSLDESSIMADSSSMMIETDMEDM